MDKIENVNLANGNFSLAIPLTTIGGRGTASFNVTLAYNSKVWTSQADREPIYTGNGALGTPLTHYSAIGISRSRRTHRIPTRSRQANAQANGLS
jgi:hypothetical protein